MIDGHGVTAKDFYFWKKNMHPVLDFSYLHIFSFFRNRDFVAKGQMRFSTLALKILHAFSYANHITCTKSLVITKSRGIYLLG